MKMRTMLILTLLSVGLLLAGTGIAGADVTKSIPASATLEGVSTLSVEPVTYGAGTAPSIAFGTVSPGEGFLVPPQYIKVEHDDNSPAWWIKIYTDNFATEPSTTTWGYQYGGMIGTPGARLPMGWHARVDNSLTLALAFAAGDPAAKPSVGWFFLKDKSDKDIPGTYDPDTGDPIDESWLGPEDDAAYANVAFGSASYQRVVDPMHPNQEDGSVEDNDKAFVVEVEGLFGSAPADSYSTTISFDLVHQ